MTMPAPCEHCRRRVGWPNYRGLCRACYDNVNVRRLYPNPSTSYGRRGYEPTEEELDAVIAEQRKNLPPWWNDPDPE